MSQRSTPASATGSADRSGRRRDGGARKHGSIVQPGCLIHSDITGDALEWIYGVLHFREGVPNLPPDAFEKFHATIRVQTFDDIDVFVNIAVKTLSLSSMATMGLRELVVNAVEHGNLEISFDEKSDLLARGAWQAEIARRLTLEKYRDRATSIEILRGGDRFSIDIIDQGPGFDWRGYIDPKTAPKSLLGGDC